MLSGKYRAIVTNIKDPENRGRIKVKCPKVYGEYYESPWCLPCVPNALDNGGIFAMPHLNEVVWIEFEEGNPQKPIWVGSWWVPDKAPLGKDDYASYVDLRKILKTKAGHLIEIDDSTGAERITIQHSSGSKIEITTAINIEHSSGSSIVFNADGSIVLTGTTIDFVEMV